MSRTIALEQFDRIGVASPCTADWNDMRGDERVRFCDQCRLNVYNLSALSREDAVELVERTEGRLCVRFFRRADGTILTRDCPVGLRAVRLAAARAAGRVAAAAAFLIGGALMLGSGRGSGTRLRNAEPFATLCRWISPQAAPPVSGVQFLGECALPTAPSSSSNSSLQPCR